MQIFVHLYINDVGLEWFQFGELLDMEHNW